MATLSEALTLARQHHRAGRLEAAEQIYRLTPRRTGKGSVIGQTFSR